MSTLFPKFQPQNPAFSNYSLGWKSCTTFAGAMAAAFEQQVKIVMTGGALRNKTGDFTGGTSLSQIDTALQTWNVDLAVHYRMPWTTFAKLIDDGMGAVLDVWYGPIADYHNGHFDAGRGFRANHAIFVPPMWGVMDPLADGRPGAYKFKGPWAGGTTPGEAYPEPMLRDAAGKLNLSATGGYKALGAGLVYAAFTHDKVHDYHLAFDKGEAFFTYSVSGRTITGREVHKGFKSATGAPCTPPLGYTWPGHGSRSLVRVTAGGLSGAYVAVPQAAVHLEVAV